MNWASAVESSAIRTPAAHVTFIQSWPFREKLSRMRIGRAFRYPVERPSAHVNKLIQMRISRVMIMLQGKSKGGVRKEFRTVTSKQTRHLWIVRVA